MAGERGKLGKEGDGGVSHGSGIRSGTAAGGGEEIRVSFGEAVLTFSNRSSKGMYGPIVFYCIFSNTLLLYISSWATHVHGSCSVTIMMLF